MTRMQRILAGFASIALAVWSGTMPTSASANCHDCASDPDVGYYLCLLGCPADGSWCLPMADCATHAYGCDGMPCTIAFSEEMKADGTVLASLEHAWTTDGVVSSATFVDADGSAVSRRHCDATIVATAFAPAVAVQLRAETALITL